MLERSSLHILGEDRELRSDRAEKPAGDEVGMLGEIEPGLQLTQEIALARRAGRGLAVRKSEWGSRNGERALTPHRHAYKLALTVS